MKQESGYLYSLTILYFGVSLIGILHHELWLDESQSWLLARDSKSLIDLIKNTRYEGHPLLWHFLLFALTRLTQNPVWMQVLHIGISTAAVFLFLKKAPFSWLFKGLFIFGYFMVFEYNILSRNYMPGVFFIFLAASLLPKRSQKFHLISLWLALASNVHLIFSVIGLALFGTLMLEHFQNRKHVPLRHFLTGYLIFGMGILMTIIQVWPPADTLFFDHVEGIPMWKKFQTGFMSQLLGLLPIPDFRTIQFWNTNALVIASKPIAGLLGIGLYLLPILLFFKSRKTLLFVYGGLFGTQVFLFITQMTATRYFGLNYFLIIIGLWVNHDFPEDQNHLKNWRQKFNLENLKNKLVYGFLVIQFCCGLYAYSIDLIYPFTTSRDTVDFLKANSLDKKEIITLSCEGTCLSPYLGREVWFLCNGGLESHCHWNLYCQLKDQPDSVIHQLTQLMRSRKEVIYISAYPLLPGMAPNSWHGLNPTIKFRLLRHFNGDYVLRNYRFYVYEVVSIKNKEDNGRYDIVPLAF